MPWMIQLVGTVATTAVEVVVSPLMNHIAVVPELLRQTAMSVLLSPS